MWSPNSILESNAIPVACGLRRLRRTSMRIIWTGITDRTVLRRTSVGKLHIGGGTTA